jgi:hypothetical protein
VSRFLRGGLGPHAGGWLALVLIVLLSFALYIALLRLVFGLLKSKGNRDVSDRNYWRIHGG